MRKAITISVLLVFLSWYNLLISREQDGETDIRAVLIETKKLPKHVVQAISFDTVVLETDTLFFGR